MSNPSRLGEIERASERYYFSAQQTGIDNKCRERMIRRCLPHVRRGRVLELGFMDGQWTDHFLERGCTVHVVEGATRNIEFGKRKYANRSDVAFSHALFEQFETDETFDTILMGGMLKHLEDPTALLQRARAWLKPDGLLIATTPNARSIHRALGVYMQLLPDIFALSDTDRQVGNLRHYDRAGFRRLLEGAGYAVMELQTAGVKFLSSAQMTDYSDPLLDALDRLADDMPDMGWYIYAVCRLA